MRRPFIEIPVDGARDDRLSFQLQRARDLFRRKMFFETAYDGMEERSLQRADVFHRVYAGHMSSSPHFAHIISIPAAILIDMAIHRARILAEGTGNLGARVSGSQHAGDDRPILLPDACICHASEYGASQCLCNEPANPCAMSVRIHHV